LLGKLFDDLIHLLPKDQQESIIRIIVDKNFVQLDEIYDKMHYHCPEHSIQIIEPILESYGCDIEANSTNVDFARMKIIKGTYAAYANRIESVTAIIAATKVMFDHNEYNCTWIDKATILICKKIIMSSISLGINMNDIFSEHLTLDENLVLVAVD
jgi:hypothetical protein